MMINWLLYPVISASMPFQMAIDEILFRRSEAAEGRQRPPILRFYFSSEPWMSLGYSMKMPEDKDIPCCKRLTGGGQVIHGDDLIFSLVAHKDQDPSFATVRGSYHKIHQAVYRAFQSLGAKPYFFSSQTRLPKGPECFRFPIATDLGIGSEKIAGGAQKRSAGVLLHHESIRIPKKKESDHMIHAIINAFKEVFQIEFQNADLPLNLLRLAKTLDVSGQNVPSVYHQKVSGR